MFDIFHFESFDLISQDRTWLVHKVFHIFAGLDESLLSVRHQLREIFPQRSNLINWQLQIRADLDVVWLALRLKRVDGLEFIVKFYFSKRQIRQGVYLLYVLLQLSGDSVKHLWCIVQLVLKKLCLCLHRLCDVMSDRLCYWPWHFGKLLFQGCSLQ